MRIKPKKIIKKRDSLQFKKRTCRFCADKTRAIDYKDVKMLEGFIKERGKILPSRISGNCAGHQRRIAEEIKKARFMSLVPYIK
ncbi:MAG: 30S ribosomal protein S18 [Candidatus Omnitrophica bacterium]|nr:30S ribosomal protein S18 [Candidatus Omnitrophota bacterium]